MPLVYEQLLDVREKLEKHYRDVQDIEFTIQEGKLFLLQTRNAKRTTQAALKIALILLRRKTLQTKALLKVNPQDLDKLLHPTLDPRAQNKSLPKVCLLRQGAVTGRAVFSTLEAESWAARGEQVILVRDETSPEDIGGMYASWKVLTTRGGMTSHAAGCGKTNGKCCVAGCSSLEVFLSYINQYGLLALKLWKVIDHS